MNVSASLSVVSFLALTLPAQNVWYQVPATGPTAGLWPGIAYATSTSKTYLYGGAGGGVAETWDYDGVDWTLINTPTLPPARQKVYMAYDVNRGVCVMQGGQAGTQLTDCWEYDGGNWRQVGSTPSPARGENGTAYDIGRGVTVVFGGWNGVTFTETWEYGPVGAPVFNTFGTGCAGSAGVPAMAAASGSLPGLGQTFTLDVTGLPPAGGLGYMTVAFQNYQSGGFCFPLDLGLFGLPSCTACVPPGLGIVPAHTTGSFSWGFVVPNDPALQGQMFYAQAASLDAAAPNGVAAFSNAGEGIMF